MSTPTTTITNKRNTVTTENTGQIFRPLRVQTRFYDPSKQVTKNTENTERTISVSLPPGYNDCQKLPISRKSP